MPPARARGSPQPPAEMDVLVMGSLLVELTPVRGGTPIEEMKRLAPLPSGAASNFALALRALGPRVGLLGRVGDDPLGEWLLREMRERGVDTRLVRRAEDQLTPVSLAWADLQGGKGFLFYRFPGYSDPLADLSPAELDRDLLAQARVFDFTEAVVREPGVRRAALQAARWAREAGRQVVYAVNYRPAGWKATQREMRAVQREAIEQADVCVMNEEEFRLIFGQGPEKYRQSYKNLDIKLVITAGEQSGWVISAEGMERFSPYKVDVAYDVGAGDSFHAGLVAGLIEGRSLREAAQYGAACAAVKISRPASSPPPGKALVRRFLREQAGN